MEASEHLPGCNLGHTARQRCSSWPPEEPRELEGHDSSPNGPNRLLKGCLLVPIVLVGTLLMLLTVGTVALWVGDLAGLHIFPRAPELPAYAYPPNVEKAGESSSPCNLEGREQCRRVYFHLPEEWETFRDGVAQNLVSHGWTLVDLPGVNKETFLSARSPSQDTCLRYQAREPGPLVERPLTYKQLLTVVVSPCSFD